MTARKKKPAPGRATGPVRKARHDGWTAARREIFLDHYAEHGVATEACRAAGMDEGAAYRLCRRDPEFAAQYAAAFAVSKLHLEELSVLFAKTGGKAGRTGDPAARAGEFRPQFRAQPAEPAPAQRDRQPRRIAPACRQRGPADRDGGEAARHAEEAPGKSAAGEGAGGKDAAVRQMNEIGTLKRWIGALADRPVAEHLWALRKMSAPELRTLCETWRIWARDGQLPPRGRLAAVADDGRARLRQDPGRRRVVSELARASGGLRIALVGATQAEVERVMIRGTSGLMAVARTEEDLIFYPSRGLVEFASGAQAFVYSGANPDGLRGPEHHFAWCDELAKWAYPEAALDNLMLGLRLGEGARALITTTPRPIAVLQAADRALRGRDDRRADDGQ